MEVPLALTYSAGFPTLTTDADVEIISTPGAEISIKEPKLENEANF
jgi:hypothetical protein